MIIKTYSGERATGREHLFWRFAHIHECTHAHTNPYVCSYACKHSCTEHLFPHTCVRPHININLCAYTTSRTIVRKVPRYVCTHVYNYTLARANVTSTWYTAHYIIFSYTKMSFIIGKTKLHTLLNNVRETLRGLQTSMITKSN